MTFSVEEFFGNFQSLKFDLFKSKDVLLDDSNNPDKNFYNNTWVVDMQYYFSRELLFLSYIFHINSENFWIIYLNLRSPKENFEKLKDFFLNWNWFDDTQLFINIGVLLIKVVKDGREVVQACTYMTHWEGFRH